MEKYNIERPDGIPEGKRMRETQLAKGLFPVSVKYSNLCFEGEEQKRKQWIFSLDSQNQCNIWGISLPNYSTTSILALC